MTTAEEFNCIFCKETFDNKETLQIHFRKHGDPEFNRISRTNRLQNETDMSTNKPNEKAEIVTCDVCPKVFNSISKAITHKHKEHPDHDAKYFCPWCGKLFTMKHLYNKHLETNHDSTEKHNDTLHCDYCDVDFYIPSATLYHNKFYHRQYNELPTVGQSKKQKLLNQELIQIYYCTFCGEEYNNKINLHKHVNDDHHDENCPNEVLRCPLCEAIFYHLDAYELHLMFHSTEDLYIEKNDMNVNKITDFSLEAVPPIMEKVEDDEPRDDVESTTDAMSIENFLQLSMDDSHDNDIYDHNTEKVKPKKHKKHKKSKKAAITLDEFLNMNKDVFGEGLDFQGIEEVPTQVVAKQLKSKKQPQTSGSKSVSSTDLDKLKKQGIIVKNKSNKTPVLSGSRVPIGKPVKVAKNCMISKTNPPVTKTNAISTSSEVLSKLISQSNNQIKITKKSQELKGNEDEISQPDTSNKKTNFLNKSVSYPKNEREQHNLALKNKDISSDSEFDEKNDEPENDINSCDTKLNTNIQNVNQKSEFTNSKESICHNTAIISENPHLTSNRHERVELNKSNDNDTHNLHEKDCNKDENLKESNDYCNSESNMQFEKEINADTGKDPLNTLRNIGHQITIKSLSKPSDSDQKSLCTVNKDRYIAQNENPGSKDSLNALKRLSNITVKSLKQMEICTTDESDNVNEHADLQEKSQNDDEPGNKKNSEVVTQLQKQAVSVNHEKFTQQKEDSTSLNALKNLGRNITIKNFTQKTQVSKTIVDEQFNDENDEDENDNMEDKNFGVTNFPSNFDINNSKKQSKLHDENVLNSLKNISSEITIQSPKHSPKPSITSKKANNLIINEEGIKNINVSLDPKNITKKAHLPIKNQATTSNNAVSSTKIEKRETRQEIEIFNIDDSDSDESDRQKWFESNLKPIIKTPMKIELNKTNSIEFLKGIGENVAVKSLNQVTHENRIKSLEHMQLGNTFNSDESDNDENSAFKRKSINKPKNQLCNKNMILKNTLKQLSKHITVKSGNSSQDSDDNVESDLDSCPGKLKITEITEDNITDDEISSERINKSNSSKTKDELYSNIDHDDYEVEEFSDFESQITSTTLKKPLKSTDSNKTALCLDKLKNISKNVTIKSLNENKLNEDESKALCVIPKESPGRSSFSASCQKSMSQNNVEMKSNKFDSNVKVAQGRAMNQSVNQKVNTSMNEVNTVNKEVTVKTLQTETVIEEVTTTVTRTIKTVNQSVKQEVRDTNSPIRTQKNIQGFQSLNPQSKHLQGITVRHASPAGPKIRNPMPSVRPMVGATVRPSSQMVPVRPRVNTVRPRMPTVKTNLPSTSGQQKPIGRPLKIAPNVVSSPVKRPASSSDDVTGNFTCFKKPKDSLIPVSDVSVLSCNEESESAVHFASTSHVTKSNFISTTKTVKGNAVVTSTQMRSEDSCVQQLSKLGNISGLKIMKSNKVKQATQVQEVNEVTTSKQSTLDALERLQKQGLLVKKPRLEQDYSDHSNSSGDDNPGNATWDNDNDGEDDDMDY